MKLLLFGNPALATDNLALRVGKLLAKDGYETLYLENPLGLVDLDLVEYVILDVAYGIKEVNSSRTSTGSCSVDSVRCMTSTWPTSSS